MRKSKTARTQGTQRPRHLVQRGLIAKADIPLEHSAGAECGLDNLSHRTFGGRRTGPGIRATHPLLHTPIESRGRSRTPHC